MKQCLHVLGRIQPATREEWRLACYDDEVERCKKANVEYSPCDMGMGIQQCIKEGCTVSIPADTRTGRSATYSLAGLLEAMLTRYAEGSARRQSCGEKGLRQLNFTVRLGEALVSVDCDGKEFHLHYRPNTPGGQCYQWRCHADGTIDETKGTP